MCLTITEMGLKITDRLKIFHPLLECIFPKPSKSKILNILAMYMTI